MSSPHRPVHVLLEGDSEKTFLRSASPTYNSAFKGLLDSFTDCCGWTGVETELTRLEEIGESSKAVPVLDADVFGRTDKPQVYKASAHPNRVWLRGDFESAFDDWMIIEALQEWDPTGTILAGLNMAEELARARDGVPQQPSFYSSVEQELKTQYVNAGGDVGAFSFPSKSELAAKLADVCNRWRLLPRQIRELLDRILAIASANGFVATTTDPCPGDWKEFGTLALNREACEEFGLNGLLLVQQGGIVGDLCVVDLERQEATVLVSECASGYAAWSFDGQHVVFRQRKEIPGRGQVMGLATCDRNGKRWSRLSEQRCPV